MDTETLIGMLTFLLAFIVFTPFAELVPKRNLQKLVNHINNQNVHQKGFSGLGLIEKIFNFSGKYYKFIGKIVSKKDYERFTRHIVAAGLSDRITTEGAIASKYTLAIFMYLYIFTLSVVLNIGIFAFFAVFLALLGYLLPESFLKGQAKTRQLKITRELPSILNTLAIMMDAGLGLFEAIDKVCEVKDGEFVKELRKVNEEVKMGMLRKDAFLRMSDRCDVVDVSTFVSALVQVLERGASGISIFIKDQALELWGKRLDMVKELGAKTSMKLFMPMVILVFPAVGVFVVGPIILNAIQDIL